MRGQLWQNHVATAGLCVSLTTVFNDCLLAAHFFGKQKSLTVFCLALNPPLTRKKRLQKDTQTMYTFTYYTNIYSHHFKADNILHLPIFVQSYTIYFYNKS